MGRGNFQAYEEVFLLQGTKGAGREESSVLTSAITARLHARNESINQSILQGTGPSGV